jgi:cytochrome oxidase assembly protein ShyY1
MMTGTHLNDSVVSGVAGAVALTAVHQAAKMMTDAAPQMDVLGMRALARATGTSGMADESADVDRQRNPGLFKYALAGDLLANSAYYSLATTWTRGAALGLAAGIGALILPRPMGLGDPPHSELLSNKIMTVAWYTLGGLAAAWTAQCLARRRDEEQRALPFGA